MKTKAVQTDGSFINYTYDGINPLVKEEKLSSTQKVLYTLTYTYDKSGNRLTQSINNVDKVLKFPALPQVCTLNYTYNADNQLLNLIISSKPGRRETNVPASQAFVYDINGNLVKESTTNTAGQVSSVKDYSYDFENRLTRLVATDNILLTTQTSEYKYDGSVPFFSSSLT